MSQQYRMVGQNHVRSASHIIPQQNQKYHTKIPVQTQSTSQGSSISNNRSKSSVTKLTNFLINKSKGQCNYCVDSKRCINISSKVNTKLYQKYSSSQNYYYTRDINEILTNARSGAVILFKDLMFLDENEQYMKRLYLLKEYPQKIKLLTEYYKFHQDIPRLFMLPTTNSLNNFHDRKRRLEYYRIAEIIEEENKKNPKRPPKGIVGDKPDKLETESTLQEQLQAGDQNAVGEILLNEISSFVNRGQDCQQNENQRIQIKKQERIKKRSVNQKKNKLGEISLTILELNKKLDQISNNGHYRDQSSMMMSQITNNSNLQDFLKHMDNNVLNYANKPIKLMQKNQKDAMGTHKIIQSTNIQNIQKNENQTIKPQQTIPKQSFKQKVSDLKLDDLDQLLMSKKSNTSNTEQQYSARSIQIIINNKNLKLVQDIIDKLPQTSKNYNKNQIKFEHYSTKSQKPSSNNFVLNNNNQSNEMKKKCDKKLNFQLNLKNLEHIGFTNLSLKSAKNNVQNDQKKINVQELNIQSPFINSLSTNYSPRQSLTINNKSEQIQPQMIKKISNTITNQIAQKKINYTKKQITPSSSQNKKMSSLDEDNNYQYKQPQHRPSPQSAQTHRAFNFTNTPSTTKTTENLKENLKAKPSSANSSRTSNKTKKVKSPRNSNQNSIAQFKHQNLYKSSGIQQMVDYNYTNSKFQFNQQSIKNNNNINVNLNVNQPKKNLHKHAKSETFNFNLNLNPVYEQNPYENYKRISYNQSPECRELQKKPEQMQKEVMEKLSQFNFSHNFINNIKGKDKDMGVLQSERGTNSTLKTVNKIPQKQAHSKNNSQKQQQIKTFQI